MNHPTLEESRRYSGKYSWVEKRGKCSSCGLRTLMDATNVYCDLPHTCWSCNGKGTLKAVYTNKELGWDL